MKRMDIILAKLNELNHQVEVLELNARLVESMGKTVDRSQLVFQTQRRDLMAWAQVTPEATIQVRIAELERELGPLTAFKYQSLGALTPLDAEKICYVELLELALGTHPALRGSR